jgi:polyhydroxyalkanoate synthesis regulator phasin
LRHRLILSVAVLLLAGAPAVAHQKAPSAALDCPSLSRESKMQTLLGRIEALQMRLDSLDVKLQSFEIDRRQALDEVKASIEAVVRDPSRTQPEIDSAVSAALARADREAKTVAASAASTHAEMKSLKGQIDALMQQLHKLAKASGRSSEG